MEGFLRRLMDRRVKVDLFIQGLGWIKQVNIRNVNAQLIEFAPDGGKPVMWAISSVFGATEDSGQFSKSPDFASAVQGQNA